MKRRSLSRICAALTASALSLSVLSYGISAAETNISEELSEIIAASENDTIPVWVWLKDSDRPDFDKLAAEEISPKTEEEYEEFYSLSEMERTDLELAAKRRLIKEYYCAKRQELLNETGIMSDRIRFESDYTPSMVLDLTAEQIKALDGSELVESIGLYDEQSPVETASESSASMTKEQFLDLVISENEDLSDGGFVYRGDLKFDALLDNGSWYLIVYGIKKSDYTPNVGVPESVLKYNVTDYTVLTTPDFYSGCFFSVKPVEGGNGLMKKGFAAVFYVENVLPGYPNPVSNIVEASLFKTHEIASYIYPTIKKGDIDNDGMLSAIDASYVLSAYAYSSTGHKIALNYELFDYNDDGLIDAIDASRILADYAWNMTH